MKYRFVFYPLIGFLVVYLFDPGYAIGTYYFVLSGLISTLYTGVLWEGNQWIVIQMKRKYPHYTQTSRRILTQGITSLLFTFCAVASISMLVNLYFGKPLFNLANISYALRPSLIATFTITTISEASYFFGRWRNTLLEAEQLKRANIQSQFETLKNQVNPHFLFNSLNTLITLIPENPQMAVEFVQKLSNVYRYVLQIKDKEVVTLAEELKVAEAYLFLLKNRFGNNLHVAIHVPEITLQHYVIPLAIQLLLENAIKHNIISAEKPLQITIRATANDTLLVSNSLQRKITVLSDSTATGLANIQNRYQLIAGKAIDIQETPDTFMVSLPLLRIEKKSTLHDLPD